MRIYNFFYVHTHACIYRINNSLCVVTCHIIYYIRFKCLIRKWGGASWLLAHPSLFGAGQSSSNVAAVSQWSLWHADDSLPETTGASQSNDDLSSGRPITPSN